MKEVTITIVGNIAGDVRTGTTDSGYDYTSFTLAQSDRRYDRKSEQWVNDPPSYYRVTSWRGLAANAGQSLKKGQPVIVVGRQKVRTWKHDDHHWGGETEVDAYALGHDLNWGISTFAKPERPRFDANAEREAAHQDRRSLAERQAEAAGEAPGEGGERPADGSTRSGGDVNGNTGRVPSVADAWAEVEQHGVTSTPSADGSPPSDGSSPTEGSQPASTSSERNAAIGDGAGSVAPAGDAPASGAPAGAGVVGDVAGSDRASGHLAGSDEATGGQSDTASRRTGLRGRAKAKAAA